MSRPRAEGPTLFSDELLAVGKALSAIRPQQDVSDVILRPALSALGAVAGAVLLVNARGDRLELVARQGYAEDAQTIWQDGPLDRHVPAIDALRRQEALFFEDSDTLRALYPHLEEETGAISPVASAVLPILLDGHALGVLVLDFREPHVFTPGERQFLNTLAIQCAIALDRATQHARLLNEQGRQIEVLESISDAFYAVDDGWRFTYVNRRAEELWGRRREDLIGRVYWEEFPEVVDSEPYRAHLLAARERRVVRLEAVSPVLKRWIAISIYPTAHGLSVYFTDITERKALEARARDLTRDLERQVAERTRDLQDLNAELRAYAIGISRDLSEPLRRVGGFIGLLERRLAEHLNEGTRTLFRQAREETRRVEARMDELRQLAVLERRELHEEPLRLDQLLVQVRSDLEPLLKNRRVQWRIGTLPNATGDVLLLRQVFAELLAVALDATRGVVPAVIEVEGDREGGLAVVRVRHNGAALSPDEAATLFDLFQATHAPDPTGERIGLANVRRIVARHGGRAWAEPHGEGEAGATLAVALPDRGADGDG